MPNSEARNPRSITFLAYVLWSFPLTYILLLGAFYNLPFTRIAGLFFSFAHIFHSIIAIATGFALYRMKPYAWHFFVFNAVLMFAEQFYVAYRYAENHVVEIPLVFMNLVILGSLLLVKLELRVPYFNPKIAWWEVDPRYKISVPVQMTSSDHLYKGDVMDISASGCFIKTKDPLKVDQVIQVKFSLFDHKFDCRGRVVWRTDTGVTHPKGIGLKFIDLEKPTQQTLKDTVKKLKNLSKKYQSLRAEQKATNFEKKVQALITERKS
ncbi:MAG: PilZ domain-containing protein [Oligoflexia bacterium]|nr:PilZ domain-containing protein [Oligoflexia bacterium]